MRYVDLTVDGEPLNDEPFPVGDGDVLSVPAGVTVTERPDWTPPPPPERILPTEDRLDVLETDAVPLRIAARIATADAVRTDEVDGPTIATLSSLYPPLTAGLDVEVDEVYSWDGTLVVVRQAHTTQQDWLDELPLALYTIKRTVPEGGAEQWKPGITVAVGDILEFEGVSYRVVQAHTTQAGWTPPAVPALWAPV